MLEYTLKLHEKSTPPTQYPFKYKWEEIGLGCCYGPAFGHRALHQTFNALVYNPEYTLKQMYNNINNQEASGILSGSIWMPNGKLAGDQVEWNKS